ncbi:uncharacterized protein [Onthophagus taurus]|uniref:uncharacterized protein n=1 Tax=Onthophagus taurus TaxID=166361 RepID=UPI0039BE916C
MECAAFVRIYTKIKKKRFNSTILVRKNCGESTNRNLTYLESPNYPNFYPEKIDEDDLITLNEDDEDYESNSREDIDLGQFEVDDDDEKEPRDDDLGDLACIFWVDKVSKEIQQIRIDFIDFELIGPSQNGDCFQEKFVVSGQNINNIPIICGYNSGQHYYIDVNALKGPLQFSILSTSSNPKRYKMLITQLSTNCNNNNNCLQSYDSISGVIQSFNYESSQLMRSQPQYMNNLNYAICIKKLPGFCSITYQIDQNDEFDLINNNEDEKIESSSCENDYIVLSNTRICNEGFTTSITDNNPGPIVINVRSDEEYTGRGFKINFNQNKC